MTATDPSTTGRVATGSLSDMDLRYLRVAVDVAARAAAAGELPYGSVLVDAAGTVLASEHNTVTSSGDITAHPELKLARLAAHTYTAAQRVDLTLFTSCQPCVMCTNAIARAGLGRVVYALSTDQLHQLQPSGLPGPDAAPVHYDGPALFTAAAQPIRDYYQR